MPPLFNMGARKRGQKLLSHSSHSQSPNVHLKIPVWTLLFGVSEETRVSGDQTGLPGDPKGVEMLCGARPTDALCGSHY